MLKWIKYKLWHMYFFLFLVKLPKKCNGDSFECKKKSFSSEKKGKMQTTFRKISKQEMVGIEKLG